MSIQISETPDSLISSAVHDLNTRGYAVLPDYIDPEDLGRMRSFVHGAMEKSGHQYIGFTGPDQVQGSGLEDLYESPSFTRLMRTLYERGTGRPAPDQQLYHVLRCLCGETGKKHSFYFHYDSYVVTALLPIEIPREGRAGDLLVFPNMRGIRPAYLLNAADKVLLDNPLTQKLLRFSVERRALKPVRITMKPGNLYFFWGYRSIHANEPCDPERVRATALFHYANPHKRN